MPGIRTPSNILALKGAYKKNPQRRRAPEPEAAPFKKTAPSHLSADEKKAWRELVRNIAPGVLQQSDRHILEQTAVLVAEWREATGEFKTSRHALMQSCFARLGMTPSDRARVTVAQSKANKFDRQH